MAGTYSSWDDFVKAAPDAAASNAAAAPTSAAPASSYGSWDDFVSAKPDTPSTASGAPAQTGMAANLAANAVKGGADALNTIADPIGNTVGKWVGAGLTTAHDALAPVFGYQKFTPEDRAFFLGDNVPQPGTAVANAAGRALDAPSADSVVPADGGQALAGSAMRAAVGTGLLAAPTSLGQLASAATTGAVSGVASEAAGNAVPEEYAPLVSTAAGMGAGAATAGGLTAAGKVAGVAGRYVAPITQSGREATVGARLNAAATDAPAALDTLNTALANPDKGQIVPGSQPTLYQLTGDKGLGSFENAQRVLNKAPFEQRADDQNVARTEAIKGAAPANASGDQAVNLFRSTLDNITQKADAGNAADQASATQAVDALPGNFPTAPGQAQTAQTIIGQNIREPVVSSLKDTSKAESDLWQALNPDGSLTVDITPVANAAQAIQDAHPKMGKAIGEDEAGIYQTAQDFSGVQPFDELTGYRSRVTDAIRAARELGDAQQGRRLNQLLTAIDGAIDSTIADKANIDAAAVQSGTMAPQDSITSRLQSVAAPSVGSRVFTPSGRPVDVQYGVREASDLIPSQLPDGRPNPDFPADLQPRDRTRAASVQQINSIANQLEPERLGASASTAEGAPIIGPDGVVESGNGRTLAIQQAHAQGGPQSQAYRDWLTSQGYDVSGMQAPILVRQRMTPLTDAERPAFTDDAGASPVLGMSAAERGAADAKRIPADTLALWRSGDVGDPKNINFVRSFAEHVLPPGEQAEFVTADGKLSADGVSRVQNALLQRAYGSNSLLSALAEHNDENIRAFGGALQDAAGDMAKLRVNIDDGMVPKSTDLSPALVEAANIVQQARRRGVSLADAVAQQDAFSQPHPMVGSVLRAAYGDNLAGRMSRSKLADLLSYYADQAQQQSGLFGENRQPAEIFGEAAQRYGYAARTGTAGAVESNGASLGANGDQARGSVDGQAGQANARASDQTVLPKKALKPTFSAADKAQYDAARAATAAKYADYFNAPGIGAILKKEADGSFKVDDSNVASQIFAPNRTNAAERIAAAQKIGVPQPALEDAAAYSFRQNALKPDGTVDPVKAARWNAQHSEAMNAFPELGAKFADATTASQTLADNAAVRQQQIADYQKSVAGSFLPGNVDPTVRMGQIINSATAAGDLRTLAAQAAKSPDAQAGLQRLVIDNVLSKYVGNKPAGNTGTNYVKSDLFQTLLKQKASALGAVLNPDQMQMLQKVGADLNRSSMSAPSLPGSPTAHHAADVAAHGGHGASVLTQVVLAEKLGELAEHLSGASGAVGSVGVLVLNAARMMGLGKMQDLATQAVLNPELGRALMTKASAKASIPQSRYIGRLLLANAASQGAMTRTFKPQAAPPSLATPADVPAYVPPARAAAP